MVSIRPSLTCFTTEFHEGISIQDTDVTEQGIDLQHITLLRWKFCKLIADLHIQQKLSLILDQIQDLFHLAEDLKNRA